jgi:exodeoxyribonuclease-3
MKIASFNINNINRRLTNLLNWLREAEPDIVCLQELKAADTEFPAEAIRQAGYHAVCRGERRWNGVAILAQWAPVVTRMDLPGDAPDGQCRYLEAAVNGVLVASIYAPNGTPSPASLRAALRISAFSHRARPTPFARSIPKADVDVLGLHAKPFGARWRPAS